MPKTCGGSEEKVRMLSMYEIEHHETVKDWIIAHNPEEAINILEDFHANLTDHRVSFAHCKVTRIPDDMQTMTNKGLMTVKEIIEYYGEPRYVKAG